MRSGYVLALCLAFLAAAGCEAEAGGGRGPSTAKKGTALKSTHDTVRDSKRWLPFTKEELSTMKTLLINHKNGLPICKPPKMKVSQETRAVAEARRKADAAAKALKTAELHNHHLRVEKKRLKAKDQANKRKIQHLQHLVSERNVDTMQRKIKMYKMLHEGTGKDGKRKPKPKAPSAKDDKYAPFLYLGSAAGKGDQYPRLEPKRKMSFKNIAGMTFNGQGSMLPMDEKNFRFKNRQSTIDKFRRQFFMATFEGKNAGGTKCTMDFYVRIATRKYCRGGALVQYEHYGENKSTKGGCNEWYMKATSAVSNYFGLDRLAAMVKMNKKCYGGDVSAKSKQMKKMKARQAAKAKEGKKNGKAAKARIMAAQEKAAKRNIPKKQAPKEANPTKAGKGKGEPKA